MYGDVTFNSVPLNVTDIIPIKEQKTIKQVIGKKLAEIKVLGLASQQWRLQITGNVLGTSTSNLDTNRSNLEALDSVTPYVFADGALHNGTYILVPGSLQFSDSGSKPVHYDYTMTLVQQ